MTTTVPETPRAAAAAYHPVAYILDEACPGWDTRPSPSTTAASDDTYVQFSAVGNDAVPTIWHVWPDQWLKIRSRLRHVPRLHVRHITERL